MDKSEIMEAVEVALGDTLGSDGRAKQSVSEQKVLRQTELFKRTLRELEPYVTVEELLEALDD